MNREMSEEGKVKREELGSAMYATLPFSLFTLPSEECLPSPIPRGVLRRDPSVHYLLRTSIDDRTKADCRG